MFLKELEANFFFFIVVVFVNIQMLPENALRNLL